MILNDLKVSNSGNLTPDVLNSHKFIRKAAMNRLQS